MSRALCYDKETQNLYNGWGGHNESLFAEHDKKGWKETTIQIPSTSDEIIIRSNFDYGRSSYLYAKILIGGKFLLNFQDLKALHMPGYTEWNIVRNGLEFFHVQPGNWDELFDIIVKNYNDLYTIISECANDIEKYFNELDNMIFADSISIFTDKTYQKTAKRTGTFLVLLHAIDVLSNIIKCKEKSLIADNTFFTNRLLETCRNFIQRFLECYRTWEIKEDNCSLKRFSKGLLLVCDYVEEHGKPLEFVNLFTNIKY